MSDPHVREGPVTTDEKGVPSARRLVPATSDLGLVRQAAATCTGCHLYLDATQTVFGEGQVGARVMMVGEQPGDKEDLAGAPFVGPAGKLLDTALVEAGIDRRTVYVTNAVKHFKWRPSGKRRLHEKPNQVEIAACRPWLEAEIALVGPEVIVCLGATAAQALIGRAFKVRKQRGQCLAFDLAPWIMATLHPSSILRPPDDSTRAAEMRELIRDLAQIPVHLERRAAREASV